MPFAKVFASGLIRMRKVCVALPVTLFSGDWVSLHVTTCSVSATVFDTPTKTLRRSSRFFDSSSSSVFDSLSSSRSRIWSPESRLMLISSLFILRSPQRTRSKAFSRWWVKAASLSKPNIEPDPFMVCIARKARSTQSASSGASSSSSMAASRSISNSSASSRKVSSIFMPVNLLHHISNRLLRQSLSD